MLRVSDFGNLILSYGFKQNREKTNEPSLYELTLTGYL